MRKQLLTILGATVLSLSSIAQTSYVHQVIYLNEGRYDYWAGVQAIPVSLGSYNLLTGTYSEFDVIDGVRFGSDVLIDGDFIYVAADTKLLKYDKYTLTLSNSTTVEGIRKIAIWNNQILVTIGGSIPHNAYFRVFDKTTLASVYELDTLNGPSYSAEGIVVSNDTAYIAVSNAFEWGNAKGLIGLVDLNAQNYMAEIDIAPDGLNPDNLMISGNTLYTLNNKDWTSSSITEFNTLDRTFSTTNLDAPSGCGASVFADSNIFYHRYDYDSNWTDVNTTLNVFNVSDLSIDTVYPNLINIYGMVDDTMNNQIYLTKTDYFSFGMAYKMLYDGTLVDSFAVGVSAGSIAIDTRQGSYTTSSTAVVCDSYTVNGNTYITSSSFVDTVTTAGGGTHIMSVDLTINYSSASSESLTACDSTVWNGTTYKTSGTYTQTILNMGGCDSVMTLVLTIDAADPSVTANNTLLTSNATGATYQWVDCDNGNAAITDETDQSYTATDNGNFAVMVTDGNGCVATSACFSVTSVGIQHYTEGPVFTVHPNLSSSIVYIEADKVSEPYELIVTDIAGRQVYAEPNNHAIKKSINIENWPNGVYMINISSSKGNSVHKIVKY